MPRSLLILAGLIQVLLLISVSIAATSNESFHVYISDNPPFNYQDENGIAQGIAVDVLKIIANRSGIDVSFSADSFINWPRAIQYTTNNPNNILLSPARTPQREEMYKWVGPLSQLNIGLIALKDRNILIRTRKNVIDHNIGVIRDSAPIQILRNEFGVKDNELTILSNDEQLFLMLSSGRVDLIPRGALSAIFWMNRLGLSPKQYEMVYVLKELELYIAFSPTTDPVLIQQLNDELLRIKRKRSDGSSEYQDISTNHTQGHHIDIR